MKNERALVEGDKEELEKVRKTLVSKGIEVTDVHLVKATGRYLINFRNLDGYRLQARAFEDARTINKRRLG